MKHGFSRTAFIGKGVDIENSAPVTFHVLLPLLLTVFSVRQSLPSMLQVRKLRPRSLCLSRPGFAELWFVSTAAGL